MIEHAYCSTPGFNVSAGAPIEGGTGQRLSGYALLFDSPSKPMARGNFTERVDRAAVTLPTGRDVRFLIEHADGQILGRTRNGTLELATDARGVRFVLHLPATSLARDLAELVRLRTIDSMSFGFSVTRDRWNATRSERVVEALTLFEISAVSQPAYPDTSVDIVGADSMTVKAARAELVHSVLRPHRVRLDLLERRQAIAVAGRHV